MPLSWPQATTDLLLSLQFSLFYTFHVNGISQYVAFCVWHYFVHCVVSEIHSYHACISSSFVFCWEVFHCIAIPHFVYPFTNWWTFGWFLVYGNEHFCKCLCMDIFPFIFGRYHEWNCCIWLFKELPGCSHSSCIILYSFTLVPVLCESCSFSTSILFFVFFVFLILFYF